MMYSIKILYGGAVKRGCVVQLFYWGACVIGRLPGKQVLIKGFVRFKRTSNMYLHYTLSLVD